MWTITAAAACLATLSLCVADGGGGWKPIVPPRPPEPGELVGLGEPFDDLGVSRRLSFPSQLRVSEEELDQCALYKVSMSQELYFQYIQYKVSMPDMEEFTMCAWTKFYNHSNDHPIFSYAVGNLPRAILVWVANTDRSSYFSMSVAGHTLCRLNYPMRLNRWYHSCHSWNGRTGEWQVWVNAERVGRGFHNRLVGYKIPGGGVPLTGQEQRQLGGGFLEGPGAPRGSGGMLGEITLLHLYSAALYPGKAHRDHKHHHGHHHEVNPANGIPPSATAQPTAPPTPPPQPFPPNPFLIGGQLIPDLNIQAQLGRPHLGPNGVLRNPGALLPELQPAALQPAALSLDLFRHKLFKRNELTSTTNGTSSSEDNNSLTTPFESSKTTNPPVTKHKKRSTQEDILEQEIKSEPSDENQQTKKGIEVAASSSRQGNPGRVASSKDEQSTTAEMLLTKQKKRAAQESLLEKEMMSETTGEKQQSKRGILLGLDGTSFVSGDFLGDTGILGGTQNILGATDQQFPAGDKPYRKDYDREPAEGEVLQILNVCSGCAPEPFKKVEVISWRLTSKKLYSGALFVPANQECRRF